MVGRQHHNGGQLGVPTARRHKGTDNDANTETRRLVRRLRQIHIQRLPPRRNGQSPMQPVLLGSAGQVAGQQLRENSGIFEGEMNLVDTETGEVVGEVQAHCGPGWTK